MLGLRRRSVSPAVVEAVQRRLHGILLPGDLLVTSGLGGAFPSGYPVATVGTVNRIPQEPFADVTAVPMSSLDQVREVMLIWSAQNPAANDSAPDGEPATSDEDPAGAEP